MWHIYLHLIYFYLRQYIALRLFKGFYFLWPIIDLDRAKFFLDYIPIDDSKEQLIGEFDSK